MTLSFITLLDHLLPRRPPLRDHPDCPRDRDRGGPRPPPFREHPPFKKSRGPSSDHAPPPRDPVEGGGGGGGVIMPLGALPEIRVIPADTIFDVPGRETRPSHVS